MIRNVASVNPGQTVLWMGSLCLWTGRRKVMWCAGQLQLTSLQVTAPRSSSSFSHWHRLQSCFWCSSSSFVALSLNRAGRNSCICWNNHLWNQCKRSKRRTPVVADFRKKKKENMNCEAETPKAVGILLRRRKGKIRVTPLSYLSKLKNAIVGNTLNYLQQVFSKR